MIQFVAFCLHQRDFYFRCPVLLFLVILKLSLADFKKPSFATGSPNTRGGYFATRVKFLNLRLSITDTFKGEYSIASVNGENVTLWCFPIVDLTYTRGLE